MALVIHAITPENSKLSLNMKQIYAQSKLTIAYMLYNFYEYFIIKQNINVITVPKIIDINIETKNLAKAKPNISHPLDVSTKLSKPLQTSNKLRLTASLTVDSPIASNNKFELTCIDYIILTTATGSTADIILAYEK